MTCAFGCFACSFDTRICHGIACVEPTCDGSGNCTGPLAVYRSVGPGNATPLATGESNALKIARGLATFAGALPDRVGVGDVVLYSQNGGIIPDRIAFISSRTSGMVFGVQARDGSAAVETQVPDTHWSVFRAYTSLASAVTGDENVGLPAMLADFDSWWPNGNDLVSANLVWHIACYADAPDVIDQSPVIIWNAGNTGWTTGPANYLRLFSPSLPTEVGQSQRHRGAYDAARYELVRNANGGNHLIDVFADFVRIEGLQIVDLASNSQDANINVEIRAMGGEVRLDSNILRGNRANLQGSAGILFSGQARLEAWNNVIAGFSGPCVFDNTTPGTRMAAFLYNNTLYDCGPGPFPKGTLLLETLVGQEALGKLYLFQLSLLSQDATIEPDQVIGKPLAVAVKLNSGAEKFFHGIVTDFRKTGSARVHTRYQAILKPRLSEFGYTSDCRIFNDAAQDALAIVTEVLAQRGLTDVESGTIKDHPFRAREFCVQYRESDLNFVQRLLEEEGIYYFFRHEENKHKKTLA